MSELNEFLSAQPENRTTLEEALEYAWHRLIEQSERPFPSLRDPLKTPGEFVTLLAGERGVLDWQPSDTNTQRRQTTAQAFSIHSKAGTRSGLASALMALGFKASVQRGESPYSIDVTAEIESGSLSPQMQARLNARVSAYKSERDKPAIDMVRGADVLSFTGAFVEVGVILDCQPYVATERDSETTAYQGVLVELYTTLDCEAA